MATDCVDLQKLGHLKSVFYTVKSTSLNGNKLHSVYCDFTQEPGTDGWNIYLNICVALLHYDPLKITDRCLDYYLSI